MSPGCQPDGEKPTVWKGDEGWNCQQTIHCLKCDDWWWDDLAEDATFREALRAAREDARPKWVPAPVVARPAPQTEGERDR